MGSDRGSGSDVVTVVLPSAGEVEDEVVSCGVTVEEDTATGVGAGTGCAAGGVGVGVLTFKGIAGVTTDWEVGADSD